MTKSSGSLAGRLIFGNNLLMAFFIIATSIFSFFLASRYIDVKRAELIAATGSLLVRVLERPMSQGDFSTVEGYVQSQKLPDSFTNIIVKDQSGDIVAESIKENNACTDLSQFTYSIGRQTKGNGKLIVSVENCTKRAEKKSMFFISMGLLISFVLIGWIATKFSVKKVFEPLNHLVSAAAKNDEKFTEDLIEVSPTEIKPLVSRLNDEIEKSAQKKFADEVFHDLISPVTAISNYIPTIADKLNPSESKLLASKIKRIIDLLNHIRREKTPDRINPQIESVDLSSVIQEVVSEQQIAHPDLLYNIEFDKENSKFGLHGRANRNELFRILSNMINNSIEANAKTQKAEREKKIIVKAESDGISAMVTVVDTGVGIEKDDREKVFKCGYSTKQTGKISGLGLSTSSKLAQNWGGRLFLKSSNPSGTTMALSLPIEKPPAYMATQIVLTRSISNVVVIDDERDLVEAVEKRFEKTKVDVHHFTSQNSFVNSKFAGARDTLFLVDFYFKGKDYSGIDIISKHLTGRPCFLVTSMSDRPDVISFCFDNKIGLVSKPNFAHIPIVSPESKPKTVFVDNEKLLTLSIEVRGRESGIPIDCFNDPYEFLEQRDSYPLGTTFILDNDLGKDKPSGIEIAESLSNSGHSELYLYTGSSPSEFKRHDFLKDVIQKDGNSIWEFISSESRT